MWPVCCGCVMRGAGGRDRGREQNGFRNKSDLCDIFLPCIMPDVSIRFLFIVSLLYVHRLLLYCNVSVLPSGLELSLGIVLLIINS